MANKKNEIWIVTIANYDEPGEGLAVFAPVICKDETEVANFINKDMKASFQNEGWTVAKTKAYPPNYDPDDPDGEKPVDFHVITAKEVKNNKEWTTPPEIQLWTKWKVTKWEM